MKIEAGTKLGNSIKFVWDCLDGKKVLCKWVDTDTGEFCYYTDESFAGSSVKTAEKIVVDSRTLIIYINPPINKDAFNKLKVSICIS